MSTVFYYNINPFYPLYNAAFLHTKYSLAESFPQVYQPEGPRSDIFKALTGDQQLRDPIELVLLGIFWPVEIVKLHLLSSFPHFSATKKDAYLLRNAENKRP